jgi:hypothetical protein
MNTKALLLFSLIANVLLLGTAGYLAKTRSPTAEAVVVQPNPVSEGTAMAPAAALGAGAETAAAAAKAAQSFDWHLVESEDYKKYIANLRAIGCPEETIRDIIAADVNKLFESRRKGLAGTNRFEFWKAGNPLAGMFDPEKLEKQQQLSKEKRALLKELLGVAPDEKPDLMAGAGNMVESMLDFLPAGKQSEVMELMQKYQTKILKSMSGGSPDAEDMKQMVKVQKDMEAEMAQLLTPQELEDYHLRLSQTSMMMRMQLASFQPTEQEFRDIFKLKKTYDDEYGLAGQFGTLDKAERQKQEEAKKDVDGQIKMLLGADRYAEYELAQDFAYQGIYRVAERNGLTKEDAVKVYDMKKAAEEQAMKTRQDQALSGESRTAALQEIRKETENAIKGVFGEKAWDSYRKQPNAYWIRSISPDPKND